MRTFTLNPIHSHSELDYDAFCECAEESRGNFYDFIPRGSNRLVVSVGDLPTLEAPSITVPGLQAMIRGFTASSGDDLADVARELNGTLYLLGPRYLCVPWFYALIDPARQELRYVNAGHESPFVISREGSVIGRLEPTGAALGLSVRAAHRVRTMALAPGDVLAILSEGLAESLPPAAMPRMLQRNSRAGASELTRRVFEQADFSAAVDRTFAAVRVISACEQPIADEAAENRVMCAA